ncbi:hypothetical protein H2200_013051 [Cladophialophora chaetospira]|uniref:Metallo-beta-lactamase domain-containing protein n=1 Tax=Cladophialophora chaetospira TaxID=386627 RepID=A0AA39CBR6_9EURO|nr:hypothetical protein H2200_013051 [Cladophialophora chaetospira]
MASSKPLQVYYHITSEKGLNSVTTLIVGSKAAVVIDAPFLQSDGKEVLKFIQATTEVPVVALFATHHHPDHFFAANVIMEAYPNSKLYAHPYVRAAVDREYDDKVEYWTKIFGRDEIPEQPLKPEIYNYSFFTLEGDETSPICLLGPVFGDTIDHTLFWLPREKVVITGDAMYGRSDHVWVGDIETLDILSAWNATLRLIEGLQPDLIIPGHLGEGWVPDAKEDLRHMHQYLDRFESKLAPTLTTGSKTYSVNEIFQDFKDAFPHCTKHHEFILCNTANQFGSDGQIWEENKHHNVAQRTKDTLEGWCLGPTA